MDNQRIRVWSFSGLNIFETCPYWAYLKYIQRSQEPKPKADAPNVRGSMIHDEAELYVRGDGPFTTGLKKFKEEFEELRELFKEGKVSLEEEWGINEEWAPVSWQAPDLWARMKLDACVHISPQFARVIDYKTGKSWGNEVKHAQQGILYGIAAMMRFPDLEEVSIEFWYLDEKKNKIKVMPRQKLMLHLPKIDTRARVMTSATFFPTKPNKFNCRWCPYRPGNTGACDFGVDPE